MTARIFVLVLFDLSVRSFVYTGYPENCDPDPVARTIFVLAPFLIRRPSHCFLEIDDLEDHAPNA
jgi:hypothetical protein